MYLSQYDLKRLKLSQHWAELQVREKGGRIVVVFNVPNVRANSVQACIFMASAQLVWITLVNAGEAGCRLKAQDLAKTNPQVPDDNRASPKTEDADVSPAGSVHITFSSLSPSRSFEKHLAKNSARH